MLELLELSNYSELDVLRSSDSHCSAEEEHTEGLPSLGDSPVSSSYSELQQVIRGHCNVITTTPPLKILHQDLTPYWIVVWFGEVSLKLKTAGSHLGSPPRAVFSQQQQQQGQQGQNHPDGLYEPVVPPKVQIWFHSLSFAVLQCLAVFHITY